MSIDGDFLKSVEVRSDGEDGSQAALFCKTAISPGHIVGVIDKVGEHSLNIHPENPDEPQTMNTRLGILINFGLILF